MIKVYKANSVAHIVVVMNGKSRRVSFAAKTGGGSTFRTDDEALQKAIESHYRFGELFHLAETIEDKKPAKPAKATSKPADTPTVIDDNQDDGQEPTENNSTDKNPSDVGEKQPQTEQDNEETENETGTENDGQDDDIQDAEDEQPSLTKVNVTDLEDARDYLSDKFGISRTKIRSQKAVKEAASANGIEFVGI